MKIVLSRKGFDSASGGGPSPIVDGRPVSLPIPAGAGPSRTTYGALGLGGLAGRASRGRLGDKDPCHHDPMFLDDGTCLFGQVGAAQTHLANQGVGAGDIFLFFGLFREEGKDPHHRIFGYLRVEQVMPLPGCDQALLERANALSHPHALAMLGRNDTLYHGPGRVAAMATPGLRLTVAEGPPSLWEIPPWLRRTGLSYHDRTDRWLRGSRLRSVARGQEFVADIGRRRAPREWAEAMIAQIERRPDQ
ncbi:hypothetical protein FHS61_002891 [Altererythrobacter atlanticus]|nr:hypothetical protein [Croceibacterium atlanticum]MBB5733845.1 hypothetical protein [Croceibacterium atlanticum]